LRGVWGVLNRKYNYFYEFPRYFIIALISNDLMMFLFLRS
jgi:hypothetical protein